MRSTRYFQRVRKKLLEAAHTDYNCAGTSADAGMALNHLRDIEIMGQCLIKALVQEYKPQHDALIAKAERVFGKRE